jgi:putative membrane protein insertion efficiency factor
VALKKVAPKSNDSSFGLGILLLNFWHDNQFCIYLKLNMIVTKNYFIFLSFFMYFLALHAPLKGQQSIEQKLDLLTIPKTKTAQVKKNHRGVVMRFYQSFISSQDGENTCMFYPSCSQYAINAVRKKGLLLGMIMAADRLTRCNQFELHHYDYNEEAQKHQDHAH